MHVDKTNTTSHQRMLLEEFKRLRVGRDRYAGKTRQ